MNTDKIYAEQIANEYAPKQTSKVKALRRLDAKAKNPARIFTYTFGVVSALVMGTGMSLTMGVIAPISPLVMGLGIGIGGIGILGVSINYPLYKKIRSAQPNVPIVFMTRPNFLYDPTNCRPRREVIYNNYLRAKSEMDENVYFIDGETLLGKEDWFVCTVDNCHPNDLGFSRMAKQVETVLNNILKKDFNKK